MIPDKAHYLQHNRLLMLLPHIRRSDQPGLTGYGNAGFVTPVAPLASVVSRPLLASLCEIICSSSAALVSGGVQYSQDHRDG
jgi:hypothetical protein